MLNIQEMVVSNVNIVKAFTIIVSGDVHLGHVIMFAVLL